jgi:prefoldin subunit 5
MKRIVLAALSFFHQGINDLAERLLSRIFGRVMIFFVFAYSILLWYPKIFKYKIDNCFVVFKMADTKKTGSKKAKVALIVCAVLAVTFAFSNIWFFLENENLQNQVNRLEADKTALQNQVSSLEAEKNNLQTQVSSLEGDKSSLESQISNLESEKSNLQTQINSLNEQIASLESQILDLTEITSMKKSVVWVDNETLIYQPDSFKTWQTFSVNYPGLLLVRVQKIPESGYAETGTLEVEVELSASKTYISRQGTLHLSPGAGEYYYTSTALIPVADLTFPVFLQITVRNPSSETVRLAVTITYVY